MASFAGIGAQLAPERGRVAVTSDDPGGAARLRKGLLAMRTRIAPALASLLAGAGILACAPAHAQSADDGTWIRLAGFLPDVDTKVSVARPDQVDFATLIDLESDLDLSDRDVLPAITVGTRLGGNWRVEGEFFRLRRSGEQSIAREIVFDGVTYPVAAAVSSEFNSDVYRLSFGYSFIREEKLEIGAALGIHATNFEVALSGEASAGGGAVSTQVRRRDVLAPLPTLGVYLAYEPIPSLHLGAQVDYLSLSIGDYDGELLNLEARASYAITGGVKIGALYRKVDYRLDITKRDYTGRMEYQFDGPALFLEFDF